MYNTFKNERIATAYHSSRQVGTEQFTVTLKHNNNNFDILKNLNRQKQPFHCNGFGPQQNHMMKPPLINEKIRHSVVEINVGKNSPGKNKYDYQKSTFRSKENFNRKRGRKVKSVSEWIFPPGTKNKHGFVVSSLRQGIHPKIAYEDQNKRKVLPSTSPSPSLSTRKTRLKVNKKTKLQEKDKETTSTDGGSSKTMIHPVVTGAEFDNRFLKYELSPGGKKKKEILVRSVSMLTIPILNCSQAKEARENNHMEEIPDEPSRAKTSARIGPKYHARIPSKSTDDTGEDTVDRSIPG
jgi:hypothetical protein